MWAPVRINGGTVMANVTKIAFIGAGSVSFGLSLFQDIFSDSALSGSTLTLVDSEAESLDRMVRLARLLNERSGRILKIEGTSDRRAALDGAGFVVNAAAIARNRLWKLDFEIPKRLGIRHTLGENAGPGGLFFTMRTLPLIFDFVRDIEELCPNAWFLNYSNPEGRIILALGKYSEVRAVGLCHGIFMTQNVVATILGLPEDDVDVWASGLNHFQCLLHIRHRRTGEDLYPRLRERERGYDPSFMPLTRRLFRAFGYWLSCSEDHLGEYLPYGWEAGEHGYDFDADEHERTTIRRAIDEVLAGQSEPPSEWREPSGERGVDVIAAVLHNAKRLIESGVVVNRGAIPNLAADVAVEVPIVADAAGLHPVSLGPLPVAIASLMAMQASVQQLAVDAAVHASKELALQALLIDPVINSSIAAEQLLEELWKVNRPYIRKCV
jgi:alpha-galactosidase